MTDKLTDLIEQSYQLTCYVAAAFCSPRERHRDCDGNVYYIQPTTEDWWNGLREDLESLQPKLQAALAAPARQPNSLSEFLRNHAIYHESGIAAKDPEVVEHVKQLRAWADALDAMPQTVTQQPSGEVTGWKLAMCVLQSDLYQHLDDAERAECDELVCANPYAARIREDSHE
ncbi:hypothetical protein WS62_25985 [Burkholderia sp. ABCPW 14]|uniref:hypothetical protein n=1 Tax=Burkholderia sp. ABCPW 14 TaxID=1637860 RepID=UPI000770E361|nr:hypothetical protein [Burkholderia sp. ABCPW 14]KVD80774.1 hypothetical protein WS62_25985 [Burkholderia sp. ABCPW 14]